MSEADPSNLPAECCGKCRFSRGKLTHKELQLGTVKCHRFPPQVTGIMMGMHPRQGPQMASHADIPMCSISDWCGEFQP
jgi:hypothetical protein